MEENVTKTQKDKLFSLMKAKHNKKLKMYHECLLRKKLITSSVIADESVLNQEIYSNCLASLEQSYFNKKKQFRSYILNNLPANTKYSLISKQPSHEQQNKKPNKKRSIVDSNKNITLKAKNCQTGYSNWLKPMDSPRVKTPSQDIDN